MASITFIILIAVQGCLVSRFISAFVPPKNCAQNSLGSIPRSHIFQHVSKPIVIGHRGNPGCFQENTLHGFKSLLRNGANGFEVDVALTKDNKLVCFHDKNAKRLTGMDKNIADMTSAEIKRLRYKKTIKYGKNSVKYSRKRRIVFLDEVLRFAKRTNFVVFIELKPSDAILVNHAAVQKSIKTGRAVAQMVKRFGMLKQTIIISFDSIKLLHAKKAQPELVIGTIYAPAFWKQPSFVYKLFKSQLEKLIPGIKPCLKGIPASSNSFVSYLFKYGVIEKSIGALGVGADFLQFDNCTYGTSNTMRSMRQNYGSNLKIGTYTIYSLWYNRKFFRSFDWKLERIIREGMDFLITDDVPKLLRKVHKLKPRNYLRHSHDEQEVFNEDENIENKLAGH